MVPEIFVSHLIFLTDEQINDLQNNGATIKTDGSCVTVRYLDGTTDEPANEIFCNYELVREDAGSAIIESSDGFKLTLKNRNKAVELLPMPVGNGGTEFAITNGKIIHQVEILPLSVINQSGVEFHLFHNDSK